MVTNANPAILDLLETLGITPEAVASALAGTTQVATAPAKPRRQVGVNPENAGNPASYRQRKAIAGITGVWPNEESGFAEFTMADASRVIDTLKKGKSVKVGKITLKPRA